MAYNTVILKNYGNNFVEYEAYEALSPGMLVEPRGGYSTLKKHATEGGNTLPMFAIEDKLQGKGITDAYAAGDQVQVWIPQKGDEVYAQIEDEQEIAIGDFLESNGAGYLQKVTNVEISSQAADVVYPLQIVAVALDKLELSSLSAAGSSDSPARQFCRVRIV
jgi:hypothetical protein